MRSAVLEVVGLLLVVAGLSIAWLPLGLVTAGAALVLAAHAEPRPSAPSAQTPLTGRRAA